MSGRIFIVNVGVNASHPVRSPIFPDGTFEFMPIPEERHLWAPPLPTYAKLECFNEPGESLALYTGDNHRGIRVHNDPEFETFTYGDNCADSPRAAALANADAGDYLLFLSRLVRYQDGRYTKDAGFYFIGYIHIDRVLRDVRQFPFGQNLPVFGANAHILRSIYHKQMLNGFCVFKGTDDSRRFRVAVPLDRALAEDVLRDAQGRPWTWAAHRTELQTIGSYTRSIRCAVDPAQPGEAERADQLWQVIQDANPDG